MNMASEPPYPSSVELMLRIHTPLIDARQANSLAIEAAVAAMAPATKAAITADLKCYLSWCWSGRPRITAIPAAPKMLVHDLRWLQEGSDKRPPAKAATLARRIASIARMHRILGFGEKEPLPTQAGMVRDTLKGIRRNNRQRQQQAVALLLGDAMADGQALPEGVIVRALLAACGSDIVSMRDAALISLAYDGGPRVFELVGTKFADLRQIGDMTGRHKIAQSKTDQAGQETLAWLSPDIMGRVSAWLLASGITEGPVFRRINLLSKPVIVEAQRFVRHFIGDKARTRQGVVAILRRRVLEAIDLAHVELEPGMEVENVGGLSAHSFRGGLTQDLFGAGVDGASIALALRWSPTTALRNAHELTVGSNAVAWVLGKLRQEAS